MAITMCCWLCCGDPDSISSSWTRVEGSQLRLPVKRADLGSFVLELLTQIYVCWTCVFVCSYVHVCECAFVEQNTSAAAQLHLVKFLQAVTFWEKLRQPFPLQTTHVTLLAETKKNKWRDCKWIQPVSFVDGWQFKCKNHYEVALRRTWTNHLFCYFC